ncbi:hypothetical protein [Variovorax sp. OV329]|uniref:hypothetical protein n=1 Tax=Variovorax sp. OV329 TaxID=1882825 RepID=UPI0008ECBEB5|nr:hypothetical protein [Variovorax sp. OV329]SFM73795.1 hypothetical protein SAMN05444747_10880 [Variovorax sp. OV329]
MSRRAALAGLLLALAALPAAGQAQETASDAGSSSEVLSRLWLNPGFYSWHWDRDKNLEDANPGFGVEYVLDDEWSLTAGTFKNSDRERSNYIGAYYMPLQWQGFRFGAAVGAFDGYPNYKDGGWFPALIPTVAYESRYWGLNVGVIPSYKDRLYGAISFQLKVRFSAPAGGAPK